MLVKVRFFAFLMDLVKNKKGKLEIELEEGSNVLQLLNKIFELYNIRDKLLDQNDNLKEHIAILKNGREINFLSGLNTILDNNDEISIFPPVHGG